MVNESSRNHGTFILYTLGNLSADTQSVTTITLQHEHMSLLIQQHTLTFLYFALACNINSESLIDLETQRSFKFS